MKLNKMRDLIKYIAKYSLKNIAVFIAILLLVLIVFLFLTKKVIENAENVENADNKDTKLSKQAKNIISVGTDNATYVMGKINDHLNQNSKSS